MQLLDKKQLRKYAIKQRFAINNDIANRCIVEKIAKSEEFINSKNIGLYFPIKNEIDITSLVKIKNKNYYFPRCNGDELEFVKYHSRFLCKKGDYGILEPIGFKADSKILDVIYIPAVMANRSCYRLGYGKGYYDRFFSQNNLKAKKIIVLLDRFISDSFVQDDFDVKMDKILTEK